MKKKLLIVIMLLAALSCKKDSIDSQGPNNLIEKAISVNLDDRVDINMALSVSKSLVISAAIKSAPPITDANKSLSHKNLMANSSNQNVGNKGTTKPIDFSKKKISKLYTIRGVSGDTSMYIINYENGGFLILSASKKEHPILAYSDDNLFSENISETNHPVNFWIDGVTTKIRALRTGKAVNKDSVMIKAEWKKYLPIISTTNNLTKTPNLVPCPNGHNDPVTHECIQCQEGWTWDGTMCQGPPLCQEAYQIGPLLSTLWSQDCGFNTYTPSSSNVNSCYHDPVGCEATAMGQIMKYWHTGSIYLIAPMWSNIYGNYGVQTFDYSDSSMPLYSGSLETARLLHEIGSAVNMSYGPTGSGASPNHETFFKNAGYSNDVRDYDYNQYDIFTDVVNGWPCMLSGFTYAFWPWDAEGHEWICDGLIATPKYCDASFWDDYTIQLHLNWGWGGYCNGWYAPGYWVPVDSYGNEEGHHFLHDLHEVVGIHI